MAIKTIFEIGSRYQDRGAKDAKKDFENLEKSGTKAANSMSTAFTRLAGPILGAVSAAQGLSKLVDVTRQFDILNAGLITATGSAENASIAFDAIEQFATETPFNLQEVTEGFIKLKNLGLDPSEEALTAYGNTAAAMGRDLDQMIEAVADATTGEFERLKEFGIRAKSEGDNVSFTFRGVTTTIGKNAAEIEGYLKSLGQNEFAGAMAQRMDTLDGAISNLSDSWDQLFLTVSEQGAGDVITDAVRIATEAINELNAMLGSGQLEGYLNAYIGKFENAFSSVGEGFTQLADLFDSELEGMGGAAFDSVDFISDAFENLPENVEAMLQILVVEFVDSFERLKVLANKFKEQFAAIFTDDTMEAASARAEARIEALDMAREGSIAHILAERDAVIQSYEEQIKAADKARESFNLARVGGEEDSLASFGSGVGTADIEEDPEIVAAKERINYLKTLKDAQIATEEESEELAYLRRMEMLRQRFEENEIPTLEAYNRLKEQVHAKHEENLLAITDKAAAKRNEFEKKSLFKQTKQTFSSLADITSGVAQHNKGLFQLNKAAGIANAIINTYEGVSESLSAYPMPLAAVFAASHLAAGLAQVAAIRKTSFGSKNAGGTSVGSAPVTTAPSNIAQFPQTQQQQQQATQVTNLNINIDPDEQYSGRTVRRIMEEIGKQSNLNVRFG